MTKKPLTFCNKLASARIFSCPGRGFWINMNTEEEQLKSRREQVRAVGQSGNYWYAMEMSSKLKKGKSVEVIFWKSPIAP
jgi:hypothetical protein